MTEKDIIVIGSGVAGMSAALYGARSGRSTLVIESLAPGGQATTIATVENYPGLESPVDGFTLADRFRAQAEKFGAETAYDSVSGIEKKDGAFLIKGDSASYKAKAVIIATGAVHRLLGCKGEDIYAGRGVSYCATCDGPLYKGKKILVVGGGDSAVSDALYLTKLTSDLTIVHRRDRFRATPAIVEKLRSQKGVTFRMESAVTEITGDGKRVTGAVVKNLKTGKEEALPFDTVFIFVGITPQSSLVPESLRNERGYIKTDRNMMTDIPGLFAAGDVRDTPLRQLVTAAADGAVAASEASRYIDSVEGTTYQ